eukprot:Rhum_TRINITY_DN5328_c0_g1::Rhum_TRINITY_DN5328_c0_g1_i1::g.17027::m.17027/K15377/SLC44A2_4_5; solute carrier family 44 (choline transporter-like protein), member 2/4/5
MGKGKGCCCDDRSGACVSTYASDGRSPESMGLPAGMNIENPSRRVLNSDCPMLLVFFAFWIGMFIVLGVAKKTGDPRRLIYGEDYLKNLCGHGDQPAGWDAAVTQWKSNATAPRFKWQSENWSDNDKVFYPIPYDGTTPLTFDYTKFDIDIAIASAVCVRECPQSGLSSPITTSTSAPSAVFTYGGTSKITVLDYHNVWYDTHKLFGRCIANSSTVANNLGKLSESIDEIPGATHLSNFFQRSLADIEEGWKVIVICGAFSIVAPLLYVLLLRVILKPLVWLMLILVLVSFIVGGYFGYRRYDDLNNDDDSTNDHEAKAFLALGIVSWIFAALFLCFMVWFFRQINAACEIIQQAGRVLVSDMSLLLVPLITAAWVCALYVFCIFTFLYVWTMEDDEGTVTVSGGTPLGTNLTVVIPDDYTTKNNMIYYVFFGFLWTLGVLNAIGYFVISASTVQWYYSHKDDGEKSSTCVLGWLRGYAWAFCYHLGCLVTGALLVAIVQFVRFILQKFTNKFRNSSSAARCLMCCVDCCLAYLERVLQYISKNAYIMCAIEGAGFWCSCCSAVQVLMGAISYLAPLIIVSDIVFFVGKLALTAGAVAIGYLLLYSHDLAPDVDNGILLLVVVGAVAFAIASLFMSVYESCIDSMFLLIFHETGQPKDPSLYFCPEEVFKTVTGKDKTEAGMFKQELLQQKESAGRGKTAPHTEPTHTV